MPVRKTVLPVSTLCVEKITQLLIEIVSEGNPCTKKIKPPRRLDISGIKKQKLSAQKPVGNEDEKIKKVTVQDSGGVEPSGAQKEAQLVVPVVLLNGDCHPPDSPRIPSYQETSPEGPHQNTPLETSHQNTPPETSQQDTPPETSHQDTAQDVSNEDTSHQVIQSGSPHQDTRTDSPHQGTLPGSPHQGTPPGSPHQGTPTGFPHQSTPPKPNIRETTLEPHHLDTSEPLHEDAFLELSHQNTSHQDSPGLSHQDTPLKSPSQATPPEGPHQDTSPEAWHQESLPPSQVTHMQRESQKPVLVQELASLLELLSHATLHTRLFTTVVAGLDPLYMRNKATRPLIMDLIVPFINFALFELDFGRVRMFSDAVMCKILFKQLDKATRLESLIIDRSCYWRSQIFDSLNDKLTKLPHLKILKIMYICTPEMIMGLSDKCQNLCELSLKGSEKITDKECDEIAKCSSLKSLDISGTRVTGRGCWKILDAVKDLSWLHHCAFNCNSDSMLFESRADLFEYVKEQLRRGQDRPQPREQQQPSNSGEATFSLKNFWLFNPFSSDLLTTTLCPHLSHLRLDFIFQDLLEEPDVDVLASLTQLTKLEVNFLDRCSVDLASRMIEACGHRLTSLNLHLADDWFFAAQVHNFVATCCPNLVSLTYTGDYKVRHSMEECDDKLDFSLPGPAHPQLKHLKIVGVVSDQRMKFLLLHCPALTTLSLDGELEWLHDDTFTQALALNPLPHLQEVWFNVSTTVTLSTVGLVLHEDNQLSKVGRLCHMASSTIGQYHTLRSQVMKHNLDVKLIWVTDERELKK